MPLLQPCHRVVISDGLGAVNDGAAKASSGLQLARIVTVASDTVEDGAKSELDDTSVNRLLRALI